LSLLLGFTSDREQRRSHGDQRQPPSPPDQHRFPWSRITEDQATTSYRPYAIGSQMEQRGARVTKLELLGVLLHARGRLTEGRSEPAALGLDGLT
jgi:hypothetical protein